MGLNVFTDLGFPADRATEMALRAKITIQLRGAIEARQLTKSAAAKQLGIPCSTISDIQRLRSERLSLALLLRILFKARIPFRLEYGGTPESLRVNVTVTPS